MAEATQTNKEFDPYDAYKHMLVADFAYCNFSSNAERGFVDLDKAGAESPQLIAAIEEQFGIGWQVQVLHGKSKLGVDVQAIVLKRGDEAIVSYRGTHGIRDFKDCDLKAPLCSFSDDPHDERQVHSGFKASAMAIQDKLEAILSDPAIKHVTFASDSMGAAVHELARAYLSPGVQAKIVKQYNYGKPNDCNAACAKFFDDTMPNNINIDGANDLVTQLPPIRLPLNLDLTGFGVPKGYARAASMNVLLTDKGFTVNPTNRPDMGQDVFRFVTGLVGGIFELPHAHLGYTRRLADVIGANPAHAIGHDGPHVEDHNFLAGHNIQTAANPVARNEERRKAALPDQHAGATPALEHTGLTLDTENALLALKQRMGGTGKGHVAGAGGHSH